MGAALEQCLLFTQCLFLMVLGWQCVWHHLKASSGHGCKWDEIPLCRKQIEVIGKKKKKCPEIGTFCFNIGIRSNITLLQVG